MRRNLVIHNAVKFRRHYSLQLGAAEGLKTGGTTLAETVNLIEKGLLRPSVTGFGKLLQVCGNERALSLGKSLHGSIVKAGFINETFLGNNIVNMYGKCNSLLEARAAFDKMQERNVFTWTVMVTANAQNGDSQSATQLFRRMQLEGVRPNDVTFVAILGALHAPDSLAYGKQIHSYVRESGLESDIVLKNAVVCMYGRCGSLEDARLVFATLPELSSASWNGLLSVHIQQEEGGEALQLYKRMKLEGVESVRATFVTILSACESPEDLPEGRLIHSHSEESGFEQDVVVGNAVLTMYIRCGSLGDASSKFRVMPERNIVSWSAMIGAYTSAPAEEHPSGLRLFSLMQQAGVKPNDITFTGVLSLCHDLETGKMIHSWIHESGYSSSVLLCSGLINMYSRCGSFPEASGVFGAMESSRKNIICWTSIISAAAAAAAGDIDLDPHRAFTIFQEMLLEGLKPDQVTFITLLDILSSIKPSLAKGKLLHSLIIESRLSTSGRLGSALLNMYGRCGSTETAMGIFRQLLPRGQRDLSTWNALLAGLAHGGRASEALDAYAEMTQAGIQPDAVSFVSVLASCSCVGSVEKSRSYFSSMVEDFEVQPVAEHIGCVVDVMCRAGRLSEAEEVVGLIPDNAVMWMAQLSACRLQGEEDRARNAARRIVELEPGVSSVYALLTGVFADDFGGS